MHLIASHPVFLNAQRFFLPRSSPPPNSQFAQRAPPNATCPAALSFQAKTTHPLFLSAAGPGPAMFCSFVAPLWNFLKHAHSLAAFCVLFTKHGTSRPISPRRLTSPPFSFHGRLFHPHFPSPTDLFLFFVIVSLSQVPIFVIFFFPPLSIDWLVSPSV